MFSFVLGGEMQSLETPVKEDREAESPGRQNGDRARNGSRRDTSRWISAASARFSARLDRDRQGSSGAADRSADLAAPKSASDLASCRPTAIVG